MATTTWASGPEGPATVDELRDALTKLAKKKSGKALIDRKFTKDHIFAGHDGSAVKLAPMLAKLRGLPLSTLMISSMDATAQVEVLNWIKKIRADKLNYADGTWTVAARDSAVDAVYEYKFVTVDFDSFNNMNNNDRVTKSRKWLKHSLKKVKVGPSLPP